jgi:FMN phosphatase YigB (HAD superfamily)
MLPEIHAVSLDWGDTLAANTGMPYQAVQERAFTRFLRDLRELGAQPPADLVAIAISDQEQAWNLSIDPVRNPAGHEVDYAALFRGWLERSHVETCNPQEVALAVARCEDTLVDVLALFAEVPVVLGELKRRGYRIGILSHIIWTGDACRRYFYRHGLAQCIDAYSFSSEVGHAKPHPAHYTDLVNKLQVAREKILHVGDNPGRDIAGGRAFGLRTCLYETGGIHGRESLISCNPDVRIVHLRDLLEELP